MFKPGDKVICIDNSASELAQKFGYPHGLHLGVVYCVRDCWPDPGLSRTAANMLVELVGQPELPLIPRPDGGKPRRVGWRAGRFTLFHRSPASSAGRKNRF